MLFPRFLICACSRTASQLNWTLLLTRVGTVVCAFSGKDGDDDSINADLSASPLLAGGKAEACE